MLVSIRPNIRKFLTIDDLRKFDVKLTFASRAERRRRLRICAIEDEVFSPLEQLRDNGFDITVFGKLTNLEEIIPYSIVVCDLKDVYPEAKLQGAALLKRISEDYPDKYLLAYTGAAPSSRIYTEAAHVADAILPKRSTDIDQLIETLDDLGSRALKPVEVWQRVRERLVSTYIPARTLVYLEHFFVVSIQKGKKEIFSSGVQHTTQSTDLRSVVTSLVSSALYEGIKLVAGAVL